MRCVRRQTACAATRSARAVVRDACSIVGIVGGALALALSEGLRKKVLDALFGAEEEFEYTATTTPDAAPNASAPSSQPVGTT